MQTRREFLKKSAALLGSAAVVGSVPGLLKKGGAVIGCRAGRPAAIAGGTVLILLGINIVAGIF